MFKRVALGCVVGCLFLSATLAIAQKGSVWETKKSSWLLLSGEQRSQVFQFADQYKKYMSVARTAELSTREVIRQARAAGFIDFTEPGQIKPGARLIFNNRDRAVILAVIGSAPLVEGSRVIGTHHDSPHIDLKARPSTPPARPGSPCSKPSTTVASRSISGPTCRWRWWDASTLKTVARLTSPSDSTPAIRYF